MTKINHTKNRYAGSILNVDEYDLTFSNGNQATFELVNFHVATGVSALPIDDQGRFVLLKHFQLGLKDDGWSLPTGGLNHHEDPQERMQLELEEEIGYSAGTLKLLTRLHPLPGYIGSEPGYLYVATDLKKSSRVGDEPYPISVFHLEPLTALELVKSGTIYDARAITAILYYFQFVKPGK